MSGYRYDDGWFGVCEMRMRKISTQWCFWPYWYCACVSEWLVGFPPLLYPTNTLYKVNTPFILEKNCLKNVITLSIITHRPRDVLQFKRKNSFALYCTCHDDYVTLITTPLYLICYAECLNQQIYLWLRYSHPPSFYIQ